MRDLLFGDVPADGWPSASGGASPRAEPWKSFVAARTASAGGDSASAVGALQRVLTMPGLESRHYLQAWHFLKALGVPPEEPARHHLYGVVVEAALTEGLDLLAAYEDHTARYFNFSGAAVVWEHPSGDLDRMTDELLEAGRRVVQATGPWTEARPPAPPAGQVRVSMLTPGGIHFGQANFRTLAADPVGGPVLSAATTLMAALMQKAPPSGR